MTYYSSYDSPPPSSPASPSSAYIDSSPPSSPASNYFELDGFSCANDPYAGSAKATKSPRLYEKKRSRPLSPSPSPPDTKKPRISAQVEEIEREQVASTRSEGEIWSDAVARAIDEGHGHVDLENRSLTCVPSQAMLELNMLYVPSGAQELQMEKSYGRSKSFNRAKSVATEHWGFPRENLQLMLGWNSLTCLPQELFNLRKLTVLSLRFNNLSVLPPEIGQLSSLKVLNLSNNKLLFLPSELMQMNLEQLQIFPNPFLPLPRDTLSRARSFVRFKSRLRTQSEDHKPYSSIIPIFPGSVIPLFELSLRRLLSPISNLSDQSLLEEIYELPLSEGNDANGRRGTKRAFQKTLPPLVRDVLDVTNYGSVYVESTESPPGNSQSSSSLATGSQTFVEFEAYLKERLHSLTSYDAEYQRVTGKGICSSPRHGGRKFMFVVPAEECFTWEHTVAAVPNLGQVPIRWRGCQKGCLNFLSSQSREEPGPLVVAPATNGDEVDCVEDDIVQHVQLSSGFAFDGFGD